MGTRLRRWQCGMALAVLVGFLPVATAGCFGRFNLTRRVYEFNDTITRDPWAEWLVFVAFVIFPVYGIATLADAIVANSLEFWTGHNPVIAGGEPAPRVVRAVDGSEARLVLEADRSITVDVRHPDGRRDGFSLVPGAHGVRVRTRDGRVLDPALAWPAGEGRDLAVATGVLP